MSEQKNHSESSDRQAKRRHRTRMRWFKRLLALVVLAGVVTAAIFALLPKPIAVDLATAEEGEMLVSVKEDGKTRVKHRYIVTAPLSGIIPRLDLREGDDVERDQVLLQVIPSNPPLLDNRTRAEAQARLGAATADLKRAEAARARAEIGVTQAQAVAKRERFLHEKGASPRTTLEAAEFLQQTRDADLAAAVFGVRVSRQGVESAKAALGMLSAGAKRDQLSISAPVSGRVLRVFRRDEGVVAPGTTLMELGDPSTLEVVVDVLTRDAVRIRVGAPATIVRWGGAPLTAVVQRVEPSGFTRISALGVEEQRVNVVLDIREPRETWIALGDGFRVEVEIEVWRQDKVLQVPASAVFRQRDGWGVFTAEGGDAVLTPVTVGQRNDTHVQITGGLSPGDRVVVHPSDKVQAGVEIASRSGD